MEKYNKRPFSVADSEGYSWFLVHRHGPFSEDGDNHRVMSAPRGVLIHHIERILLNKFALTSRNFSFLRGFDFNKRAVAVGSMVDNDPGDDPEDLALDYFAIHRIHESESSRAEDFLFCNWEYHHTLGIMPYAVCANIVLSLDESHVCVCCVESVYLQFPFLRQFPPVPSFPCLCALGLDLQKAKKNKHQNESYVPMCEGRISKTRLQR